LPLQLFRLLLLHMFKLLQLLQHLPQKVPSIMLKMTMDNILLVMLMVILLSKKLRLLMELSGVHTVMWILMVLSKQ